MTELAVRELVPHATETGLDLPEGLTEFEWKELGGKLGRAARASGWWIGDWINYGENAGYVSRGKLDEAVALTGLDYGTLANYSSVSRRFETSRRHELLTFGHHQSAAPLPALEQDAILKRAAEEQWTISRLREETRHHPSRPVTSPRRHEALVSLAAEMVKLAEGRNCRGWERSMTDSLTPPQARKQLTALRKARTTLNEVIDAVEYRAATLPTFNGR